MKPEHATMSDGTVLRERTAGSLGLTGPTPAQVEELVAAWATELDALELGDES